MLIAISERPVDVPLQRNNDKTDSIIFSSLALLRIAVMIDTSDMINDNNNKIIIKIKLIIKIIII